MDPIEAIFISIFAAVVCFPLSFAKGLNGKKIGLKRMAIIWLIASGVLTVSTVEAVLLRAGLRPKTAEIVQVACYGLIAAAYFFRDTIDSLLRRRSQPKPGDPTKEEA